MDFSLFEYEYTLYQIQYILIQNNIAVQQTRARIDFSIPESHVTGLLRYGGVDEFTTRLYIQILFLHVRTFSSGIGCVRYCYIIIIIISHRYSCRNRFCNTARLTDCKQVSSNQLPTRTLTLYSCAFRWSMMMSIMAAHNIIEFYIG